MLIPWCRQRVSLYPLDMEERLLQVVRDRGPIAKSKIIAIVSSSYGEGPGPCGLRGVIRARPKVEQAFARLVAAGALLPRVEGQFTRFVSGLVVCA